jgi:transcription elongation factor GreA
MAETFLSQEAYDRLSAELEDLKTNGRPRISAEIEVARAHGDLRENAEYHAAKDEQGRMEARIRQIEALLDRRRHRRASSPPTRSLPVSSSCSTSPATRRPTSSAAARTATRARRAQRESPMGVAVLGAREGDTRSFETPSGASVDVRVVAIRLP